MWARPARPGALAPRIQICPAVGAVEVNRVAQPRVRSERRLATPTHQAFDAHGAL
jgi:hypothetical protein